MSKLLLLSAIQRRLLAGPTAPAVAAIGLALFIAGCGPKNDPSAEIVLQITPGSEIIIPQKGFSCTDRASAKLNPTADPSASVGSGHVTFSNFVLQWQSDDTLYISNISVIISQDGTDKVVTLDTSEVEALLGKTSAKVVGKQTIYSNPDPADASQQAKGSKYDNCGLTIPFSIDTSNVDRTKRTASFVAIITVIVEGQAIKTTERSKPERYVRAKARVKAVYTNNAS